MTGNNPCHFLLHIYNSIPAVNKEQQICALIIFFFPQAIALSFFISFQLSFAIRREISHVFAK